MRALKLVDGDFVVDSNNSWVFVEGKEEILQEIRNSFALFLGGVFIEPDEGLRWLEILRTGSIPLLRSEFTRVLDRNPRITKIRKVEIQFFDPATRKTKVFIGATADETIVLSEDIQIPAIAEA